MADDIAVSYYRHRNNYPFKLVGNKSKHCTEPYENDHFKDKERQVIKTLYYDRFFGTRDVSPSEHNSFTSSSKCTNNEIKFKNQNKKPTVQRLKKSRPGLSALTTEEYFNMMTKKCSVPGIHANAHHGRHITKRRRSDTYLRLSTPYRTQIIINTVILYPKTLPLECQHVLNNPLMQAQIRIYRCQLSTAQESCCCSCNSDAMFEVMKGLYDCYKKKNCNNCDCVLCGHLVREGRRLDEARKSKVSVSVGVETTSTKQRTKETMPRAKEVGLITPLIGKTSEEKEKIIQGLASLGLALPEAQTKSEKKLIEKVRKDVGLPPEPKTIAEQERYREAERLGLVQPLEGKTELGKIKILQRLRDCGVELPQGRTPSEKALIAMIKAGGGGEKIRNVKASGLLTSLEGKTSEQKEKIIKARLKAGLPLTEGKTASERSLIKKVISAAIKSGISTPFEKKTSAQKEVILKSMAQAGIPLPEGKTTSEQAIIKKIAAEPDSIASQKLRNAIAAGLFTPLEGKTPSRKEKFLRGLAKSGIPMPEGKTPSEKTLIQKVRTDMGLPPAPTLVSMKEIVAKAQAAVIITPLSKSPSQKEKALRKLVEAGIPLPEAKTASGKALVQRINKEVGRPDGRLLLKGKTSAEKERILKSMAEAGIPLPPVKTASEKAMIQKIKEQNIIVPVGPQALPPEERRKLDEQTSANIQEREGPVDECICSQLTSESKRVSRGPPTRKEALAPKEKMRAAKAAALLTPLEGKTTAEKERIVKGLAKAGIPLPEGKTPSFTAIIQKVIQDTGLPPEPKTKSMREKISKAQAARLVSPLEGKTSAQKEILKSTAQAGIPLPEGRTPSEKNLIKKIEAVRLPSQRMREAKAAGLITPLEGKSSSQKEQILKGLAKAGIPLPEGNSASEKEFIRKIRTDMGGAPFLSFSSFLEPKTPSMKAKFSKAQVAGLITPLEGKTPAQKKTILRSLAQARVALPEDRTPSESAIVTKIEAEPVTRVPTEKLRDAKAAGLLTPLEGKTSTQKEKILRGLAKSGLPMPEGKTPSEKALIQKVRADMGLPPAPTMVLMKGRVAKAQATGIITPLVGKSPSQKEKALRKMVEAGIPLPEAKTASGKVLVQRINKEVGRPDGRLLLKRKTSAEKARILKSMAEAGIPLPAGKTASEKAMIQKVKKISIIVPTGPQALFPEERRKLDELTAANLQGGEGSVNECICPQLTPGSERVSRGPSTRKEAMAPLEKMRAAKAAGLLTPIEGKTSAEKERIVTGLAKAGILLPEGKTPSEKALIQKVQTEKISKAQAAGLVIPLEGKTSAQREVILKSMAQAGIPLPEGRTPSEKALIKKFEVEPTVRLESQKIREAIAAGLFTSESKTYTEKERLVKGLAKAGIPMPEGKTPPTKAIIQKLIKDMEIPPEPKTRSMRKKISKAQAAGLVTPLEGKTSAQKEVILKSMAQAGFLLPEGRTPSEKALIKKIEAEPTEQLPSPKMREAKAAGLLKPLEGKTYAEKERIVKGFAKAGIPLPEGKTPSEKALIQKVITDMGLSPEPKTSSIRGKKTKAQSAGLATPLEGKTSAQKEVILKSLTQAGIPFPKGITPSEKALINKIEGEPVVRLPSQKMRIAKAAGLITPLKGKSSSQKEKILKGLAKAGMPLPEGKTASEKQLIRKIKMDEGLPLEPKIPSIKEEISKARATGLFNPLEGKVFAQKKVILKSMALAGIPLPEGRTPSEKALIKKIEAEPMTQVPTEKLRDAKAAGLLILLEGKTSAQTEKKLRGLAKSGIPMPEGKTLSEKKLIQKVRTDMGLPPAPTTVSMKERMVKAQTAGTVVSKTISQKEKALRKMAEAGILLPEAKTASGKALVQRINKEVGRPDDRFILKGKTSAQKERILKCMKEAGISLPAGKTASEKAMIQKVKEESIIVPVAPQALPSEEERKLNEQTAKNIKEEERPVDECICPQLTPGSERVSRSPPTRKEAMAPIEKMRAAKAAGLLTPLEGKTSAEKERIVKGLATAGIPLPEGKTPSVKALIQKVTKDMGLPPEPKTRSMRKKISKAQAAGLVTPLEGKTSAQKEVILKGMAQAGIPLPEGRTLTEKALIKKIEVETTVRLPSQKMRDAIAAGLLTPLEGKTYAEKERLVKGLAKAGIPLPAGKTASVKAIIQKVIKGMGLPLEPKTRSTREKILKAQAAGLVTPLEGKTSGQKEVILKGMAQAGIPLPEGRTPSEKALINKIEGEPVLRLPFQKMREAKAAGLITPLEGKSSSQKEKLLKGLAKAGIPLPQSKTPSEKQLIKNIRTDMGLPPEPTTPSMKDFFSKAQTAGLITPLEGKTPAQKEVILKSLAKAGVPLPGGRTLSERALVKKIEAEPVTRVVTEKLREAKSAGLLTTLEGKTSTQKETILRGLAKSGLPMPEGKTPSEKALIQKVRTDMGLPPVPITVSMKERMSKAQTAGTIRPLVGKTLSRKEKVVRKMAEDGIPLPEAKTASGKALVQRIIKEVGRPDDRFILKGKTSAEKERILKSMAEAGIPIPAGKTASEKAMIQIVKKEISIVSVSPQTLSSEERRRLNKHTAANIQKGKEPVDKCICPQLTLVSDRVRSGPLTRKDVTAPIENMRAAKAAGLLTPLEGKTSAEKVRIVKGLAKAGIPLPEGKTPSEKALIQKVVTDKGHSPEPKTTKMKDKKFKAHAAGLVTPFEGKISAQKEVILKGMAQAGIPLPEGRTPSEKALIKKIEVETTVRLPLQNMREAIAAGLLTPLEGKTYAEKERLVKGLAKAGIPLPEGKTSSVKALIQKVIKDMGLPAEPKTKSMREKKLKAQVARLVTPIEGKTSAQKEVLLTSLAQAGIPLPEGRTPSEKALIKKIEGEPVVRLPSQKMREAKAAGLIMPLEGKSSSQKEKLLKGLAKAGIPMPQGKAPSEKQLIKNIRTNMGLPPEPTTPSMKGFFLKAQAAGLFTPLEGKTPAQKEVILKSLAQAGVALPEGRTRSERALVKKIEAGPVMRVPMEKLLEAKSAGLLTPLEGKTSTQKETILRGLAKSGLPMPEGKTSSEKALIQKVRTDMGLPPVPTTVSMKERMAKAQTAGTITPLVGKTVSQKEKALRKMAEAGIPLPEAKTASGKALVQRIIKEVGKPEDRLLLEGKTSAEKERILKSIAEAGIPLPAGKTASDKAIIQKIKGERIIVPLGPQALSSEELRKINKQTAENIQEAIDECICPQLTPESERVRRGAPTRKEAMAPLEKLRAAKAAALLTPLEGKTSAEKERIVKGLAKAGIPLPEGKTPSEKALIQKVITDMGLPPEPKTKSMREKKLKAQAAGLVTPLEGKTSAQKEILLTSLAQGGIPLPEGRTPSEKALIKKIEDEHFVRLPSQKMREAKAARLITPLEGKSSSQKEKLLKGLAKAGIPMPQGKTPSEKQLIKNIRTDMGLPPEPTTPSMKEMFLKAQAAGLITPLEGKTPAQKEAILKTLAQAGVALPAGRTLSERALVKKIEAGPVMRVPTEKLREAKSAGLLTPLEGKTSTQKEKILRGLAKSGLPMPEGKTPSEKALIQKVRTDMGLPPVPITVSIKERMAEAQTAGTITPLVGKTVSQKEKALKKMAEAGIPLPEAKTASGKALVQRIIKEVGRPEDRLLLEGKTSADKERILKSIAEAGIPLPAGKTASDKAIIQKVKKEIMIASVGPQALLSEEERKFNEQTAANIQVGGGPVDECICPQLTLGSERVCRGPPTRKEAMAPSERMRAAKAVGLLTPLEGKTYAEKERLVKGLAKAGIPLPEGKTSSVKALIQKVIKDMGLPLGPKTRSMKEKLSKAQAAGLVTPLEGQTSAQKEVILKGMAQAGIPLPEGRTPSEKTLIKKIEVETTVRLPSQKMQDAIAAGLLTPLEGKTYAEKERVVTSLAKAGIPMPAGKTPSVRAIIQKVIKDMRLPPEPKTRSMRENIFKAQAAGLVTPLEGKTSGQKEVILKGMAQAGIPLPEGRTPSEKALINKIEGEPVLRLPSQKMREAKAAGLITPLEGKSSSQKEKILKGLAKAGILMPEGKTASEKELIRIIRTDMGLPPEPKTQIMKEKISKAQVAGLIFPAQKEDILKNLAQAGVALPEGKIPSERAMVKMIKAESVTRVPIEKLRAVKAAGLLTPLKGKTSAEKEKILRRIGVPLPKGKTPSENILIQKVRTDLGLPPEPKTQSMKEKMTKAQAAGSITLLEGKTSAQKEAILKSMVQAGIQLPEGRTASEKELVKKITRQLPLEVQTASESRKGFVSPHLLTPEESRKLDEETPKNIEEGEGPVDECICPSFAPEISVKARPRLEDMLALKGKSPAKKEKMFRSMAEAGVPLPEGRTRSEKSMIKKKKMEEGKPSKIVSDKIARAKELGLLTPLAGKTKSDKKQIVRGLADVGLPLPEGATASEKHLIQKIASKRMKKAKMAGLLTPLEGKPRAEKERILKELANAGLPLPEGKTASEKAMIKYIRTEEVTPSITKKVISAKTGTDAVRRGALTEGIPEEVEETIKTTKCERACGCDKKKIRFKHSYVKIRVRSPDISSLCPCPAECIPRVKSGVFTDNEGLKVTVGRVAGGPLLMPRNAEDKIPKQTPESDHELYNHSHISLQLDSLSTDGTTDGSGSKSTVYIYNSETDVSITDIKRFLHKNITKHDCDNNSSNHHDENKTLSYIYQSLFKSKTSNNYNRTTSSRVTLKHVDSKDYVSNPSSGSFYLIETESTDTDYSNGTLSLLSFLARNLAVAKDSSCLKNSDVESSDYNKNICSKRPVDNRDLISVYTLLRQSRRYRNFVNNAYAYHLSDIRLHSSEKQGKPERSNSSNESNFPPKKSFSDSSILIMISTERLSSTNSSMSEDSQDVVMIASNVIESLRLDAILDPRSSLCVDDPLKSKLMRKKKKGFTLSNKGGKFFVEPKIGTQSKPMKISSLLDIECQTMEVNVTAKSDVFAFEIGVDTSADGPCVCAMKTGECLCQKKRRDAVSEAISSLIDGQERSVDDGGSYGTAFNQSPSLLSFTSNFNEAGSPKSDHSAPAELKEITLKDNGQNGMVSQITQTCSKCSSIYPIRSQDETVYPIKEMKLDNISIKLSNPLVPFYPDLGHHEKGCSMPSGAYIVVASHGQNTSPLGSLNANLKTKYTNDGFLKCVPGETSCDRTVGKGFFDRIPQLGKGLWGKMPELLKVNKKTDACASCSYRSAGGSSVDSGSESGGGGECTPGCKGIKRIVTPPRIPHFSDFESPGHTLQGRPWLREGESIYSEVDLGPQTQKKPTERPQTQTRSVGIGWTENMTAAELIQKLPRTRSGTPICSNTETFERIVQLTTNRCKLKPQDNTRTQEGTCVCSNKKWWQKKKNPLNPTIPTQSGSYYDKEDEDPVEYSSMLARAMQRLKENRKHQSLQTQTWSGFSVAKKMRAAPQGEMSFEDAIEYFKQHPEDWDPNLLSGTSSKSSHRRKNECECEPVLDDTEITTTTGTPLTTASDQFKGLKIRVGGKGSGTKGLSGICCFDVLEMPAPHSNISNSSHSSDDSATD